MKFKYEELKDQALASGLRKLATCGTLKSIRLVKNVGKIASKWDKEQKEAQDLFLKLLKKYAVLDEKGDVKPDFENGKPFTLLEGKEADFESELAEFNSIEFHIAVDPIAIDMLEGVGLNALELESMRSMLIDEEVEAPKADQPDLKIVN